ncbi:retinol dehydrogenase 11 [Aspergillus similis]
MAPTTFNPATDIPSMSGKVILITGGTAGLGAEAVRQLAGHSPARIYISGRNADAAERLIQQIQQALWPPRRALQRTGMRSNLEPTTSATLLIRKLLPLLQTTVEKVDGDDVRIIQLTSLGLKMHPGGGIVFDALRTTQEFSVFGGWIRYGQSKLANLLYAAELAHRYPRLTSVSLTPGVVNTGLVEKLGPFNRAFVWVTNLGNLMGIEEGAQKQLWAATTKKDNLVNGAFYEPAGMLSTKLDKAAKDEAMAKRLWEWTEEALAEYL